MFYYRSFSRDFPIITQEEFFYLMLEYLKSNPENVNCIGSFFELVSDFFQYKKNNIKPLLFKTEDFFEYFRLGDNNGSN